MYKDEDGKLVRYRWFIAKKYLNSWFALDFVTILPFDSVKYFVKGGGDLMILRLIRLMRLLKLLRLLRASRIFQRWELRLGMQHSFFLTVKLVITLLMANHWLACCWGLTAFIQSSGSYTWMTAWLDGQHTTTETCTSDGGHVMTNAAYRSGCFHHTEIYIACLHWSMMTITSIGYGVRHDQWLDIYRTMCMCLFCSEFLLFTLFVLATPYPIGHCPSEQRRICCECAVHAAFWSGMGPNYRCV